MRLLLWCCYYEVVAMVLLLWCCYYEVVVDFKVMLSEWSLMRKKRVEDVWMSGHRGGRRGLGGWMLNNEEVVG